MHDVTWQVSAVTHTPETAQASQLIVPEIMRHRVEGRGLVIVRASSGRTLRHGSKGSAELKTEAGMKRFFACMLMALDDMSTLVSGRRGGAPFLLRAL